MLHTLYNYNHTPPKPCQQCQRPVAPRRNFCLYCALGGGWTEDENEDI